MAKVYKKTVKSQIDKIIAAKAPHGLREEIILDDPQLKPWEIASDQIHLTNSVFQKKIYDIVLLY